MQGQQKHRQPLQPPVESERWTLQDWPPPSEEGGQSSLGAACIGGVVVRSCGLRRWWRLALAEQEAQPLLTTGRGPCVLFFCVGAANRDLPLDLP